MASFEITSFSGGLSDYENKGIAGSFKFGSGLDIRKDIDSLSCGQALVDDLAAGTMTDLALFTVPASDGNTYFFCRDGKIFRRNSSGTYSLVFTDTNGAIIGAAEGYDSSGNTYLFWATSTRFNEKKIVGSGYSPSEPWTDENDSLASFPKTNLTAATWHTMKWAVGNLYICNGNTLALQAYDGSYSTNALQLTPGNQSKSLLEKNRYVMVGTKRDNNQELSRYFAWDGGVSQNWNDLNQVPANGINALVDTEAVFMQAGTNGQVFYADMQTTLPMKQFPGGGEVYPDGVDVSDGMALWGVFGNGSGNSGVYTMGRKKKNAQFVFNLEYPLECDEIGSVTNTGTDIFVTYKNGSNYGVKKVSSTAKGTGIYRSLDLKAPGSIGGKLPIWERVVITTAPLPEGASIGIKRKIDKTGSFTSANTDDGSTSWSTTGGTEAVFNIGDTGRIFELEATLTPSGNLTPEIYKIEVFFSV